MSHESDSYGAHRGGDEKRVAQDGRSGADLVSRVRLIRETVHKVVGIMGAAVCHDMNNPLQGVVGFMDIILHTPESEIRRDDLEFVFQSGLECRKLSDNLGDIAERYPPLEGRHDLGVLLRGAWDVVMGDINPGPRFAVNIPDDLRMVPWDDVYLGVILVGVLSEGIGAKNVTVRVAVLRGKVFRLDVDFSGMTPGQAAARPFPDGLDGWLGRRAARLLGGTWSSEFEGDAGVVTVELPWAEQS